MYITSQHPVIVDRLIVRASTDRLAGEDCEDLIVPAALVPRDDQHAVGALGPSGVVLDVLAEPSIRLLDGSRVHVMLEVRHHKGH